MDDDDIFPELTKASIGRIMSLTQKNQFGLLTSWLGRLPTSENVANFTKLKHQIRSLGYGHVSLRGHWTNKTTNETEHEPSLFVPGMTEQHAKLCGFGGPDPRLHQASVIHGTPDDVHIHEATGNSFSIGPFHPEKFGTDYSTVKGRPFEFKGWQEMPQSFIESFAAQVKKRKEHALGVERNKGYSDKP